MKTQYFKPTWSVCNHGTEKKMNDGRGGGVPSSHGKPQAGRRAAPPTPQAGRRAAHPTAGRRRYTRRRDAVATPPLIRMPPTAALSHPYGRYRRELSYHQLRSLRSLAGGYE